MFGEVFCIKGSGLLYFSKFSTLRYNYSCPYGEFDNSTIELNVFDTETADIYKIDQLTAMKYLKSLWSETLASVMRK